MLVDLRDFSYKLESNYVLSSGVFHAERDLQRWLNNRYAKASDVHEAIAFKTAKHADPNATAGERAFWDLRCHAYCTPFLNARKVKDKRFAMCSSRTSDRGQALEGIMKLAGSKTRYRASRASQGLPVSNPEKDIPVVWAFGIDFTGQGGRHAVFEKFLIRHLRSSGYAYVRLMPRHPSIHPSVHQLTTHTHTHTHTDLPLQREPDQPDVPAVQAAYPIREPHQPATLRVHTMQDCLPPRCAWSHQHRNGRTGASAFWTTAALLDTHASRSAC
ncbi:hypothetical protein BC831DRAFT_95900 [Entophlyctis helioformis]|nr:hypothetical protein BC831DRAFT_95900 [Entophlyctis helioformis]